MHKKFLLLSSPIIEKFFDVFLTVFSFMYTHLDYTQNIMHLQMGVLLETLASYFHYYYCYYHHTHHIYLTVVKILIFLDLLSLFNCVHVHSKIYAFYLYRC